METEKLVKLPNDPEPVTKKQLINGCAATITIIVVISIVIILLYVFNVPPFNDFTPTPNSKNLVYVNAYNDPSQPLPPLTDEQLAKKNEAVNKSVEQLNTNPDTSEILGYTEEPLKGGKTYPAGSGENVTTCSQDMETGETLTDLNTTTCLGVAADEKQNDEM